MKYKRSWFTYFLKSKGRHGIHSPFVFQFVNECLTTKVTKNFETLRKSFIKSLLNDRNPFEINDLGVGSKKMKHTRSANKLAKTASSNGMYGDLLWKIAQFYDPSISLELGTSVGIGTLTLCEGNKKGLVHTVEGCSATLYKAEKQFSEFNINNCITFNSDFKDFLAIHSTIKYDLVFLDGNHSKSATLSYLELLKDKSHDQTFFIFDDIRWNEDMWEMWQELVKSEDFHVTIDLGRMGIALKRPEQVKEHFILRPKIFKTAFF
jgi:predicted O-methyltransferase YrrM